MAGMTGQLAGAWYLLPPQLPTRTQRPQLAVGPARASPGCEPGRLMVSGLGTAPVSLGVTQPLPRTQLWESDGGCRSQRPAAAAPGSHTPGFFTAYSSPGPQAEPLHEKIWREMSLYPYTPKKQVPSGQQTRALWSPVY